MTNAIEAAKGNLIFLQAKRLSQLTSDAVNAQRRGSDVPPSTPTEAKSRQAQVLPVPGF